MMPEMNDLLVISRWNHSYSFTGFERMASKLVINNTFLAIDSEIMTIYEAPQDACLSFQNPTVLNISQFKISRSMRMYNHINYGRRIDSLRKIIKIKTIDLIRTIQNKIKQSKTLNRNIDENNNIFRLTIAHLE
jgi:hypothetical protein